MNESGYQYLSNKKWRAITVDFETLSSYSMFNSRLYCLTDFQAAWLLSMTEYYRWGNRWENCPCTQAELDAMKAELDYNLMNCLDFSPYQMQYLYNNAQNSLLQSYVNAWDGSLPSSVNPDAPDDYFDGDGSINRENALCTALTLFTYSYAVIWSQKASVILGIASAAVSFIDLLVPFGGELAELVIASLLSPTQATFDALANQAALDIVICDWKDGLIDVAITPSNWSGAVGALSYTENTGEYFVQQLLAADSQLLENFLTFVNALGDGYEYAQLGIYICPCDEIWEYTIDFTVDSGVSDGWGIFIGWGDGWVDGLGWQSESNTPVIRELIGLQCAFPVQAFITYFEFTYAGSGNFPVNTDTWLAGGYIENSVSTETFRESASGQAVNQTHVMYDSLSVAADFIWTANNPKTSSQWWVTACTIRGTGSNPFL